MANEFKVKNGLILSSGSLTLPGSSSGTTVLSASSAASGTLTLPATTDTLVGKATTDTLTNKTLSSTVLTGTLTAGGSVGTSGQILSSTATGVQWIAASSGGTTSVFIANAQSDLGYVYDSVTITEDLGTPLGTTTVSYDLAVLRVDGVVSLSNLDSSVKSDYLAQAIIFGF